MGIQAFGSETSSRFGNVLRRREKKALPFGFGLASAQGGFGGSVFTPGSNNGGGGGFNGEVTGNPVAAPPGPSGLPPGPAPTPGPSFTNRGGGSVLNNPDLTIRLTPEQGSQSSQPGSTGVSASRTNSVLTPNRRAKKGKGSKSSVKGL